MDLRRLELADMEAAARVHRAAFDDRLPWLSGLHTPEQDRAFFRDQVFVSCAVWGAFAGGDLVGIMALREGWIDQLYVLPDHQSRGVGGALLRVAMAEADELRLWTFQRNTPARAFYESRGFVAIQQTDGAGNEEREPDVLYEWRAGSEPGR